MSDPDVLREVRHAGGFTLREVANEVRVEPSTIASYELLRARPSLGTACRWEAALVALMARRKQEIDKALYVLTGKWPGSVEQQEEAVLEVLEQQEAEGSVLS